MKRLPSRLQLVLAVFAVALAMIPVGLHTQRASALNHAVLLTVPDQRVTNGTVTIADVFSHGPGYLVVYGVNHGSLTHVIGYASISAGWSYNIEVPITTARGSSSAYVILHNDTGEVGVYESTLRGDVDQPELVDGTPVTKTFKIYYPPSR